MPLYCPPSCSSLWRCLFPVLWWGGSVSLQYILSIAVCFNDVHIEVQRRVSVFESVVQSLKTFKFIEGKTSWKQMQSKGDFTPVSDMTLIIHIGYMKEPLHVTLFHDTSPYGVNPTILHCPWIEDDNHIWKALVSPATGEFWQHLTSVVLTKPLFRMMHKRGFHATKCQAI